MPSTDKRADSRGPAVEDTVYYDVKVSRSLEFQRIRFGIVSETQVSGEVLRALLESPDGDGVVSYTKRP